MRSDIMINYAIVLEGDRTDNAWGEMCWVNYLAIQYLTEHPEITHVPVIAIETKTDVTGTYCWTHWCYNVVRKGKGFVRTDGERTIRLNRKGTDFGAASYTYTWW